MSPVHDRRPSIAEKVLEYSQYQEHETDAAGEWHACYLKAVQHEVRYEEHNDIPWPNVYALLITVTEVNTVDVVAAQCM